MTAMFTALAEHGGNYGPFNTDKTLIFNKVISNVGNAYNACTGIFTAPVDGVYYFTFFYHAGAQHKSGLSLMKNSALIVESTDHKSAGDNADNGGNAAVLELCKGDRVYVNLKSNSHVWAAESRTTFTGFLFTSLA